MKYFEVVTGNPNPNLIGPVKAMWRGLASSASFRNDSQAAANFRHINIHNSTIYHAPFNHLRAFTYFDA